MLPRAQPTCCAVPQRVGTVPSMCEAPLQVDQAQPSHQKQKCSNWYKELFSEKEDLVHSNL